MSARTCFERTSELKVIDMGSVRGSPNGTIGNFTNGAIGYQWYRWLTNGTNGSIWRVNGTIGITIGTNGITNGTIGRTLNRGRTGLVVRASDSGSGDPGSILGRVGVLFP